MFRQSYCRGLADYVKVVVPCESMTECLLLRSVADEFAAQHADCVVITVGTGESAKLTRVLNRTLTPVTHGLLPSAAASGQLTAEELQRLRLLRAQDREEETREIVAEVEEDSVPSMGAEDFSYMLEARPGAMVRLGNGSSAGLHHPEYDFNDEAIPFGISWFAEMIEQRMPAS